MSTNETHSNVQQIGTVEVLRWRIYPLDPMSRDDDPTATTVSVSPGTFPVYRELDAVFWVMTGQINARGSRKIGDGMFELNTSDGGRGPEVTFPSQTFGIEAFRDLLQDACSQPGPGQRLRFDLTEAI